MARLGRSRPASAYLARRLASSSASSTRADQDVLGAADTATVAASVTDSDTLLGTDTAASLASIPAADVSGLGVDNAVITAGAADNSGATADSAIVSVVVAAADTITGADAIAPGGVTDSFGPAVDSAVVNVVVSVSDTGTGTDSGNSGIPSVSDTAAGTEGQATVQTGVTDGSGLADSAAVHTTVSVVDTFTGIDNGDSGRPVDSATFGSESASVLIRAVGDSGTTADTFALFQKANDSVAAADVMSLLTAAVPASEAVQAVETQGVSDLAADSTSAAVDTASVNISVIHTDSDAVAGTDSAHSSIGAFGTETVTGAESAVILIRLVDTMAGTDSALHLENGLVIAGRAYLIPAESRAFVVPGGDRTHLVPGGNRTYVVRAD